MAAERPDSRIGELRAVDTVVARAESVAADDQDERAALADDRFGSVAVGVPRFVIAGVLRPELIEESLADHGAPRAVQRSSPHERRAGVLERADQSGPFVVLPGEILVV